MSPAQHQIHHSVEERHHDKNFGTVLSLWDWLGGTLYLAEKGQELRYGLTGDPAPETNGLAALYLRPVLGPVSSKGAAALWTRLRITPLPNHNQTEHITPVGHRVSVHPPVARRHEAACGGR